MGGACSTYLNTTNAYKNVFVELEEEKPLGRLGCRWEETIKIHLKEAGRNDVDCIQLAHDILISCEHGNGP